MNKQKPWAPDDPRWDALDKMIERANATGEFNHMTDDWLDAVRGHLIHKTGRITISAGMAGGHRCPGCKMLNTMSIHKYFIRLTADDTAEVNCELYCRDCRTREITPPYEVAIEYDEDETR